MTMPRTVAALVLVCLSLGVARRADAQCSDAKTVCAEYAAATFVFLGRVGQVSPPPEDRAIGPLLNQNVTFDVIEDFKNTAGGGMTLTFNPGAPGARVFTPGEQVLVYAIRVGGTSTVISATCTRTRRVNVDEPELVTLRQLQVGSRGAALEGALEISADPRPPALARGTDLSNVAVSVQSMENGETVTVATHPSGYFLVPWLRPGNYRLRVESPTLAPIVRDVTIGERGQCQKIDGLLARPR